MKRKLKHLESHESKKWKDECDKCKEYKLDVHSYYDSLGKVYILCPECLRKNSLVTLNWRHEPITNEKENTKNEKNKNNQKKSPRRKSSKDNKDNSNHENDSKDKGQLLHGRVSRRKVSTKSTKHRPGTRKISLI